jgi:hypothetical protein
MTEKVFADTNIVIYAESRHAKKSPAAVAILEASPVISTYPEDLRPQQPLPRSSPDGPAGSQAPAPDDLPEHGLNCSEDPGVAPDSFRSQPA